MIQTKKFFITGIPTAGKTYLAKKLADQIGGQVFSIDTLRDEMSDDSKYGKWVNFYWNLDEKEYFTTTTPEEQWKNLVRQSEEMWPFILEKINSYNSQGK